MNLKKNIFSFVFLLFLSCQSPQVCTIPDFYESSPPLQDIIIGTSKGNSYEDAYQNALREISRQLSVHILNEMNISGDEKTLYLEEVTHITSQVNLNGVKIKQKHESCGIYYISLFIEESSAQKQLQNQNDTLEKVKKALEKRMATLEEKQDKIISKIEEKEKYQKIKARPLFYTDFEYAFDSHASSYSHNLKENLSLNLSLNPSSPLKAHEFYASQKNYQAQELCLKMNEKDPQSSFPLACLGLLSLKNKEFERALTYISLALQYENNLTTHYLYYLKSYINFEKKEYKESLKIIQELSQKSSASCLLSQYMGNIYSALDNFENAQKYYSSCLKKPKNHRFSHPIDEEIYAITLYNRALLYHKNGYFSEAWNDYSQAIQISSQFAKALFYRGYLQKAQKNDASADIDIQKALKIDPELKKEMQN